MRKFVAFTAFTLAILGANVSFAYADYAIAIGQKGSDGWALGWANNYTSAEEARKDALSKCRSEGPNCKIVAEDAGRCAAVAIGTSDNAWGWAPADTERAAKREALKVCQKYSNSDCEIKASFCDE
ncbi:MAG: DUF4189 domain-containing protein [Ancalomicrobiaceae bacterium]|nr:DUF4189 domain-containing protein [Ancalomicrobiaceae bacterium]